MAANAERSLSSSSFAAVLHLIRVGVAFIIIATYLVVASSGPAQASHVVRKYAPAFYLHSDEKFFPSKVSVATAHSDLMFRHADCCINTRGGPMLSYSHRTVATTVSLCRLAASSGCSAYAHASDGTDHAGHTYYSDRCTMPFGGCSPRSSYLPNQSGFFLNLNNDYRAGMSSWRSAPVYYHWLENTSGYSTPGRYLVFTVFFEWDEKNDSPGNHEGDWETVAVSFNSSGSPRYVFYHWHACAWKPVAWSSVSKVDGTHPKVYVAKWSHGMWNNSGQDRGWGACFLGQDERDAGRLWRTWEQSEGFANLPSMSYYGYGGAWGAWNTIQGSRGDLVSGPLGPSRWWAANKLKGIRAADPDR